MTPAFSERGGAVPRKAGKMPALQNPTPKMAGTEPAAT